MAAMDWPWDGLVMRNNHCIGLLGKLKPLNAGFFGNISEHVTLNSPLIGFPAKHFFSTEHGRITKQS